MRLIYVADPMCSRCYSFDLQLADLCRQLANMLGAPVPATVITDDLCPRQRGPMTTDKRDEIPHRWHVVAERSGMPFNQSSAMATRRDDSVYDTESTCRTVAMARKHQAEGDEHVLISFHVIQHASYSESRDTIQAGMLHDVALANGVRTEYFDAVFDTDVLHDETREDFCLSCRWGIIGFPSLLAEQGGTLYQIGRGYVLSVALYAWAAEVLQQYPVPDADQYICPSSNCGVVCVT